MKKITIILLLLLMVIPNIIYAPKIEAKTIADFRRELEEYERKQNENNSNIINNKNQIAAIQNEIGKLYTKINNIAVEIKNTNDEITTLGEKIVEKDAATKNLMSSLQLTDGDSFYLEYLFGAETIADFIYRYSLTEQITDYNEKLIDEMNKLIEEDEQKKVELEQKKIDLANEQVSLQGKISTLNASNVKLYELGTDIEDEIKNTKEVIAMYIKAGCTEDEDVKVCASKTLPADTKFWRPMETGYVTSEYGYRSAIYSGGKLIASAGIHEGIDLSNGQGNNCSLYSIANGKVAAVWYDKYGGNQLTIHHRINGVTYSSSYAHMSAIYVSVGDIVTKDTVVGKMGSTGSATGPHLHLAISTGLRFQEYTGYNAYVSRTINPRTLINLPSRGSWSNRYTMYN